MENLCQPLTYIFSSTLGSNLKLNLFIPLRRLKVAILHWAIPLANSAKYSPRKIDYTLPRNDLLSRLYWGTQWTMEIS